MRQQQTSSKALWTSSSFALVLREKVVNARRNNHLARSVSEPLLHLRDAPKRANGPFRPGAPGFIVHHCYHKVGTVWFNGILRSFANHWGLPYVEPTRTSSPDCKKGVLFDRQSRLVLKSDPPFRGTHMVRDPRDMVVSGYHYHLWTTEQWAHLPMVENPAFVLVIEAFGAEVGTRSYQAFLSSLPKEEGLRAELLLTSQRAIRPMVSWDYERVEYLELKYEDVFENQALWFERVFSHYGLRKSAIRDAMRIAEMRTFERSARRSSKNADGHTHLRSGKPGQWEEEFSPALQRLFREMHGLDLVRLGYERSLDWGASVVAKT